MSLVARKRSSIRERLLQYTQRDNASGCWEWTGHKFKNGYGCLRLSFGAGISPKNGYAHRLMYEEFVGPIPPGVVVRHTCDKKFCINPKHLAIGAQADVVEKYLMDKIEMAAWVGPASRALLGFGC